jgi:hypothetical protein
MPNKLERITKGESQPFSFDRGGASISGWVCTITAKQYASDTAPINRVIAPTGDVWKGFLTQSETSGLAVGLWFLTASLVNLATDEMEQKTARYDVAPGWTT